MNKKTGKASGFYIHTSSPADFFVRDEYITFRSISGILDFYIFEGPTLKEVIQQYHDLIGKPTFMPLWAFGWHQTRPDYNSIEYLENIVENYNRNNLTLAGIWQDYSYMKKRVPFTVNSTDFSAEIVGRINSLKNKYKFKYIPVIEEGIKSQEYSPFEEGKRMEVFVKKNLEDNEFLKNNNQAGEGVLVNYFHPNASIFWENNMERLRKKLNFEAIWSNYQLTEVLCGISCSGSLYKHKLSMNYGYIPGDSFSHFSPEIMDSYYPNNFTAKNVSTGLNFYALTGIMESKAIFEYLRNYMKKRPFIVSKRSFPGSGQYAGQWLGDEKASWENLRLSIPAMMSYHMYGIPFVGLNIQGSILLSNSSYI